MASGHRGRRTLLNDALYLDRDNPNSYVTINEFESYEAAMINSNLPETTAMAEQAVTLIDGPVTFTNLDLVEVVEDRRVDLLAQLLHYLTTSYWT